MPVNDEPRVLGNRYEVGDLLGRGGMAEVHLGRDTRLGRVVAIKLLRTDLARDPIFQARFRREAQSAAGLNHPAIVSVYDTGEENLVESGGSTVALPYIVMEYVEGRTLREVLREEVSLPVPQSMEVTAGVLSALDYSHRMGIVHRDIKPANVMLTVSGDVKVMDFGIARALADVSATMTQTQAVIGTAQYLSPEQARGETVDARSDLYSAGCLLFELLTGRPPFVADSPVAVAYQHVREAPAAPSSFDPRIPPVVDRVVLHALAKDREARYQTAGDFRADLESALAGRSIAATTGTVPLVAPQPGAAPSLPADAGAAAVAAAAAIAAAGGPGGDYPTGTSGLTVTYPGPGGPGPGGAPGALGPGGYPGYGPTAPYGPGYAPLPYAPQYAPGGLTSPDPSRRDGRQPATGGRRRLGFVVLALVVIGVFAAAAYAVSYVVGRAGSTNSLVVVPSVTRQSQAAAEQALQHSGFAVSVQQQPSDTIGAGLAIGVSPTGAQLKNSSLILFISSGSSRVVVPDVSGRTQAQARAALRAAGLSVADIPNLISRTGKPQNIVVGTEPASGQSLARGEQVTLDISDGKLSVPNEVGQTVQAATADLAAKGFTDIQVTQVPTDPNSGTTLGQVLDQTPAAGVTLAQQKLVTLLVAVASPDASSDGSSSPGASEG